SAIGAHRAGARDQSRRTAAVPGERARRRIMIRVLVVDDSAVVRTILKRELDAERDIEVVGVAEDAYDAREQILRLAPDVITLDVEMPRMNGIDFLERLMMYHPLPVVIFSSVTAPNSEAALQALSLGAVEVVAKPAAGTDARVVMQQLVRAIRAGGAARPAAGTVARGGMGHRGRAIRAAAAASLGHGPDAGADARPEMPLINPALRPRIRQNVIAIGASTGGPAAIERVLTAMPAGSPPILIVQHMPAGFTNAFAQRLDARCEMDVREARDGDRVEPNVALIAPGDRHMTVVRRGEELRIALNDGPPVHHARPSVDVLFHSI